MEKNKILNRPIFSTALIFAIMLAVACGNTATRNENENDAGLSEGHHESANMDSANFEDQSSQVSGNMQQSGDRTQLDAQFLKKAADINNKEIMLGKLAVQSGQASDVKQFGKMMETEHSKSLKELKSLAQQKSITLPSSPDENMDDAKNLKEKTGSAFDKAYCDMMVTEHKEAITLFQRASTESADADVKSWAIATLPALKNHLEHAISCQKKIGKNQ